MPKYTMQHGEEYVTFPAESILHLKVDSIKEQVRTKKDGSTYTRLQWVFIVQGIQVIGDGSDQANYSGMIDNKIFGSTTTFFSSSDRNQLKQWTEAILDIGPLQEGFELDTDLLVGRKCRGITKVWTGIQVDPGTGKVKSGHEIDHLLPAARGGQASPIATVSTLPTQAATPQAPAAGVWDSVPF